MHSHGRKIHNRISPCIHPPPSFYQPPVNYKCISFIVNSKYLILKAIILFRKTGVIDFNSGEQTRCANFIKAYCIFFASVLCQFVDKPLLYFICNAFHNAWEQQRLQKRETHFEAGKVLATQKIWFFILCAWERSGRQGRCLSPPYHISMLQMSLDFLLFVNIYTRRKRIYSGGRGWPADGHIQMSPRIIP